MTSPREPSPARAAGALAKIGFAIVAVLVVLAASGLLHPLLAVVGLE